MTPEQRAELVNRIAFELDLPSVYMGGPSPGAQRKARRIMEIVEAVLSESH